MKKNGLIVVLSIVMILLIVQASMLGAKKIPVDQVKISTPIYKPDLSNFNPPLGQYTYTVSWQSIPAGTIELYINQTGGDYEIDITARTAELIDYIYKLRYRTKAVISSETLMPRWSASISSENSRKKKLLLEFLPSGEYHSVYINHRGKRKDYQFDPDNFTLDPFSTALLALSLNWEVGDKRRFDTFNGRNRYLIELTAVEKTELPINGKMRKAIVIRPKVTKLTDTEKKKLRDAKIYVSADNSREILKISSDLMFGSLDTDMVSFTPDVTIEPFPAMMLDSDIQPTSKSNGPPS